MKVFLPAQYESLIFLVMAIVVLLIIGWFLINRKDGKWIGWSFPVISVAITHFYLINESPGYRMLALILVLLLTMKILVGQYYSGKFTPQNWMMFSLTWVGMRPSIFFQKGGKYDYQLLLKKGLLFLFIGFTLLLLLRWWNPELTKPWQLYSAGIILLISLSWILHFGLLNINASLLRMAGYSAYPLFNKPLKSGTLQEFWGKRWNLAFTEMTGNVAFKPLVKKMDKRAALFLSFMFSGVLHEVALSLSVQKGYGLPMLYFLLQSIIIVAEQRIFKKKQPGPLWVIFWLLIPLPLVFHLYVMHQVFLPLITK